MLISYQPHHRLSARGPFRCIILIFNLLHVLAFHSHESPIPDLQPSDIDNGKYDNLNHDDKHRCTRICKEDEEPRICYYKFHLEPYSVLGGACGDCPRVRKDCYNSQCVTADGVERAILTVNRRLPGPSIQVCKRDTIVVDVINQMPASTTSIHWHGVHQHEAPWMDGVPLLTQCPIMESQTFQYRFPAHEAGTHFWHSHDGMQKGDGIVGSLIIRQPDSENPLRKFYDEDIPSHVIVVQDWMHIKADDKLPGLSKINAGQIPDSYLIQGKGLVLESLNTAYEDGHTPPAYFNVMHSKRYRFRIVSGTCLSCPFRIAFQDHKVMVINADNGPIQPEGPFDSVNFSAGERFDLVLTADKDVDKYWIVVQGLGSCQKFKQVAILQYEGTESKMPKPWPEWLNPGYTFNLRNSECNTVSLADGMCFSQVKSLTPNPDRISESFDRQIEMAFGFHTFAKRELFESGTYHKHSVPVANLAVAGMINGISNMIPPSPLLTQFNDVPKHLFCEKDKCKGPGICECINLLKFDLGALVEFIIADTSEQPSGLTHPFHLHGTSFYVVEQGIFKQSYQEDIEDLKKRLNSEDRVIDKNLPVKDTITVPASGYAVVRAWLDNPGFWLWHCHFAYHLTSGMSAIVQVGPSDRDLHLPQYFPKCYQFQPAFDSKPDELMPIE